MDDAGSLRGPLIYGGKANEKATIRSWTHLFFHPDSPRTKRGGKCFAWLSMQFRTLVLALVLTNLILTMIGAVNLNLPVGLVKYLSDVNTGIIIPLSCLVFTFEYIGRIWSIPETSPLDPAWKVRVLWAIHVLPLLEIFAVVMMWVSVAQMFQDTGPETANTAAVTRAARGVRVLSKASRAARAARAGGKAARAAQVAGQVAAGNTALLAVDAGRKSVETPGSPLKRLQSQRFIQEFRTNMSPQMRDIMDNSDGADMLEEDHDHSDAEEVEEGKSSCGEACAPGSSLAAAEHALMA